MRVLLVDDEPNVLKTLTLSMNSMGLDVSACKSPLDAIERIKEGEQFDIAFLDLKMYPIDGIELMRQIHKFYPDVTVVIVTAHGTIDTAVEAIKKGAFDYLQKPFDLEELRRFIDKVLKYHELKQSAREMRGKLVNGTPGDGEGSIPIITRNPKIVELIALARRVADTPLSVLVEGESGTGKELFAQMIHAYSARSAREFVRVNCAAIQENLLESELFGHVKGAYTGAHKDRIGRFELADRGTIFLDEVGELPMQLQAKLLRVLQNREFERLGESVTRKTDVRVVAATNKELEAEIAQGNFREDLFYRLNAVRIRIPPLRERREDIPLLVEHFIEKYSPDKRSQLSISTEALVAIAAHSWRGNVRELENVMSRAVFLAQGQQIGMNDLPEEFQQSGGEASPLTLEAVEREHIARVIAESGSLDEAAKKLNIDAATLWRKRKKYKL